MPRQGIAPVKKKKKARKQVEQYCTYLIEILSCKTQYAISENRGKRFTPGPYSEYIAIEMAGIVLEPDKITNRTIECIIYGERDRDIKLNDPHDDQDDTYALIGHLTARKDYCGFTGWIPASMLLPIAQLIIAKELRYLDLMGKPLFRNYASIHNLSLIKELEADPELEAEPT